MALPLPPPDLDQRALPLAEVRLGNLMRLGRKSHRTRVFFGKGALFRFDAPADEYGVMYAAFDLLTCVGETLLRAEADAAKRPPLFESDLTGRVVARFAPANRSFRLVDLTGVCYPLGLDMRISTDLDYSRTQAWSKALHDHPDAPDGLLFQSRQNTLGRNVALFERVLSAGPIREATTTVLGRHPDIASVLRIPGIEIVS